MTELGEYLRACRARVSAEQAGIPSSGQRRVPGLRREELATLAGVSVDYVVRLEQGRAKSASPEILTALARALDLDADEQEYLLRCAADSTGLIAMAGSRTPRAQRAGVRSGCCWTACRGCPRSCWAGAWTSWRGTPWSPR